jgi:hypothetical protein
MSEYEYDPVELSGPMNWSYSKTVLIMSLVITSALLLNVFLISAAAKLWGFNNFPLGTVLLWIFPIGLLGGWFTARWVRRMVENPDDA